MEPTVPVTSSTTGVRQIACSILTSCKDLQCDEQRAAGEGKTYIKYSAEEG